MKCKYCSVDLVKSNKPRVTGSCRACKHKHYRALNPEKYRESVRKHYHRNRELFSEKHLRFKKNNPAAYNARIRRNRVSLSGRHQSGKTKAKRFGQDWTITMELHRQLLERDCHYCHGKLNITGSGLDRVDNSRGYTPDNVVPCCKSCNRIKGDILTHDEMIVAMRAVLSHRIGAMDG